MRSADSEHLSDEHSSDVGQLVKESAPGQRPRRNESDEIAQWSVTEVVARTSDLPVTRDTSPVGSGSVGSSPPIKQRRFGPLPVAAVLLGIIVAALSGYWFGTRQSDEDLQAAAGQTSPEPGLSSSSAQEPNTSSAQEPTNTDVTARAAGSSPAAGPERTERQSIDPVLAAEAIESELKRFDLAAIGFEPGTDSLTDDGQSTLVEVAAVLIAQPSVPVEVAVATFTQPSPGLNHGLSTLQAQTITDTLVAEGVDPGRLASVGLGTAATRPPIGSTALLFDSEDGDLASVLPVWDEAQAVLDIDGSLTLEATGHLDEVIGLMTENQESTLTMLAYAYLDSREASHDRSHDILDVAVGYLADQGLSRSRISTVGMGRTPIDRGRETMVAFNIGLPAAISVAIAQIDTERITFEPGTDQLTGQSAEVLLDIASALAVDPTAMIEISAHTYTEADTQQNHDLSHLQGDAIVDILVAAGVDPDRLVVTGHGDPPHFAKPGRATHFTFYPFSP